MGGALHSPLKGMPTLYAPPGTNQSNKNNMNLKRREV